MARCAVASSFGIASCASSHAGSDDAPRDHGQASDAATEPLSPSDAAMMTRPDAAMTTRADAAMMAPSDAATMKPSDAAAPLTDAGATTPDAATVPPAEWVQLMCDGSGNWPINPSKLELPVDYIGEYNTWQSSMATGLIRPMFGEKCAGASDRDACERSHDELLYERVCENESCRFLITTAGDEVTRIEERAALQMLVGTVDNELDAALAAFIADAEIWCWYQGTEPGDGPSGTRIRSTDDGYEVETLSTCYGDSDIGLTRVDGEGNAVIISKIYVCEGRRPEGLLRIARCAATSEIGAHFTGSAHLEAASVFAFEQLARDLARLGAPHELVERALRSALEEVGHARTMEALARRFGGELIAARIAPQPERAALAIAIENATEGCVRETYGALIAWHQAHAALDPQVRAAMAQIAEDETRHAELSWQIAAWLEPLLSEDEQAVVGAARREAFACLQRELLPELSREAMRLIGLPDEATASALLAQLDAALDLRA
jgi:hypothetical protein